MSEYQYYEFVAVDRPLEPAEMQMLRAFSSRAEITPTRFVNSYEWGDFKGDAVAWMESWFDGFLYLANWGTHELMLRVSASVLDARTALPYRTGGEYTSVIESGEHIVLAFRSEDEAAEWVDDGSGHLGSILPIRNELALGDLRALYLGWLVGVAQGDVSDDELEPPVPPGLGKPTAAQREFIEFLRIDPDLVRAAAARSLPLPSAQLGIEDWLTTLDDAQKTELLTRVARGQGEQVRAEMMRRFAQARPPAVAGNDGPSPRTVRELRAAAESLTLERHRQAEEKAAADRERREAATAASRARELDEFASREEKTWQHVEFLVKGTRPQDYDEAVRLLENLRDLAAREGKSAAALSRIRMLAGLYARKHSLIRRMIAAGLLPERSV